MSAAASASTMSAAASASAPKQGTSERVRHNKGKRTSLKWDDMDPEDAQVDQPTAGMGRHGSVHPLARRPSQRVLSVEKAANMSNPAAYFPRSDFASEMDFREQLDEVQKRALSSAPPAPRNPCCRPRPRRLTAEHSREEGLLSASRRSAA